MSWTVKNFHGDDQHYVIDENNCMVARVPTMRRDKAEMIAALPEMLAALRRAALALAFAAETSPAMKDDYKAVSAAIALATGAPT